MFLVVFGLYGLVCLMTFAWHLTGIITASVDWNTCIPSIGAPPDHTLQWLLLITGSIGIAVSITFLISMRVVFKYYTDDKELHEHTIRQSTAQPNFHDKVWEENQRSWAYKERIAPGIASFYLAAMIITFGIVTFSHHGTVNCRLSINGRGDSIYRIAVGTFIWYCMILGFVFFLEAVLITLYLVRSRKERQAREKSQPAA